MKMRTFEFTPDLSGRSDFRIAYEAFRGRDPQKGKDERESLAQIQRALESVSDPIGDLSEDAEVDQRNRKLRAIGGSVLITQRVHEKLETIVNETPFLAGLSVAVEDFKDRWSLAEKSDSDEAAPLKLAGKGRK